MTPEAVFRASLNALCPDCREKKFVLALSGGLDSTALLLLALGLLAPAQIIAAHLNHGLRGEEARRDQEFAAALAAERGVRFITETADVAALAAERGKGVEEAARRARYKFLLEAARETRAQYILTAHQADDQAETVLMNFIRGAGAGGLAGIHPRRDLEGGIAVLRPLLQLSRDDLLRVATEAGQAWVEDGSNQDGRYRRNALRLELIPKIKELNPRFAEAVGRMSVVLRGEEDFWRAHLDRLWSLTVTADSAEANTITLSRAALENLSLAERRRLIYEAFAKRAKGWICRAASGPRRGRRS